MSEDSGLNYKCSDCKCDLDGSRQDLCLGVRCNQHSMCKSGNCHRGYCALSVFDNTTCHNNTHFPCGKCGGLNCKKGEHVECKYLACMSVLGDKCSSCECDRNNSKTNLCEGVNCKGDYECRSGRCYLGFCALNSVSMDTCTQDVDAGCGKCDRVFCRGHR